MDPLRSAAGIRAAGSITAAVLNRYRPVGVVRCGSPEDRAQAYRRFMDGVIRLRLAKANAHSLADMPPFMMKSLQNSAALRFMEAGAELACALQGVRLCAPDYVMAVAEEVAYIINDAEADADQYWEAQTKFLEAARHDLDYNPRPWQLLTKRKARKFHKAQSGKPPRELAGDRSST